MFNIEVGSRVSPKIAITLTIASLFVAAAAFAVAHNALPYAWVVLGR